MVITSKKTKILICISFLIENVKANNHNYILCGVHTCLNGFLGAFCCGFRDMDCCYYELYQIWCKLRIKNFKYYII